MIHFLWATNATTTLIVTHLIMGANVSSKSILFLCSHPHASFWSPSTYLILDTHFVVMGIFPSNNFTSVIFHNGVVLLLHCFYPSRMLDGFKVVFWFKCLCEKHIVTTPTRNTFQPLWSSSHETFRWLNRFFWMLHYFMFEKMTLIIGMIIVIGRTLISMEWWFVYYWFIIMDHWFRIDINWSLIPVACF